MQRNKQVAMGRKKFNMDPKKVLRGAQGGEWGSSPARLGPRRARPPHSPEGWLPAGATAGAGGQRAGWWGQQHLVPLQGIQFLIENDLLKNTCEDIAQFLYKGEGLNKTAIGDYLGERCAALGRLPGRLGSRRQGDGTPRAWS